MTYRLSVIGVLAVALPVTLHGQLMTRDSLRRELPQIIAVERLPVGKDSVWVALVRRGGPEASVLVRFNRDNPYVLTYLLENGTGIDQHTLLAGLAPTADAPRTLFAALSDDSTFTQTLLPMVNRYQGARTASVPSYPLEDVMAFASHFLRLDADSAGRLKFSLCAKSWQLRELPLPTSVALEAAIYSMIRPPIERDSLPSTLAVVRDVIRNAPRISDRRQVDSLERVLWKRVARSEDFRTVVARQIDRRAPYLPFRIRER